MGSIATQQLQLLQSTNKEEIKYIIFDYLGNRKGDTTKNILVTAPSQIQPINANLSVEYLRPLKNVINQIQLNNVDVVNKNPTFRYASFDWDIGTNNSVQLSGLLDPKPISGNYIVKSPVTEMPTGASKGNPIVSTNLSTTFINLGSDLEFGFYYYFSSQILQDTYTFYVTAGLDTTGDGNIDLSYSFTDNKFKSGTFTDDEFFKQFTTNSLNQWVKVSQTLNAPVTTSTSINAKISIYPPSRNTTGFLFGANYYDAFYLGNKNTLGKKFIEKKTQGIFTLGTITEFTRVTGSLKQGKKLNTNNLKESLFVGRFEGSFKRKNFPESKTLDSIVNQEVINDYRASVKRYEGDFYRKDDSTDPLQFFNKIWVNFGTSTLQDLSSAIIDSMEYNVKSNTYKIIMHLPNQDDDILTFDEFYYED